METIAVDEDGFPLEQGDYRMAGVVDPGTEIKVAFVEPAGTMTGKLFPTGNPQDTLVVGNPTALTEPFSVQATLIDCANPFVLVDGTTLPSNFVQGSAQWLETIEDIRRKGAVMMGLADSEQQAALTRGTPKISIISPPTATNSMTTIPDVSVLSMSMGQIHPSVQLTGAVCLAAAVSLKGTIPYQYCPSNQSNELVPDSREQEPQGLLSNQPTKTVLIAHRSGQIPVGVRLQDGLPERCIVSRTARKLFEGNVLFYS